MKLYEADINKLQPGQRVRAEHTNRMGTITAIYDASRNEDRHNSVDIQWDSGAISKSVFLLWGKQIELVSG